jgi:phosphoenolpyruvate synthase/pyruvate phosphate dikinase
MNEDLVTKSDLEKFRVRLITDLKTVIEQHIEKPSAIEWVKSKQVREMLHVSPGTLQNLRVHGKIKPKKIGGSWYYNLKELIDLFGKG